MKLSPEERIIIQDFVWSNSNHKDKKAAIQATVIRYADKIDGERGISAICELMRVPISFGADIRHAILTAKKLKELTPAKVVKRGD